MADESLKEWVKSKREDGISDDRIKKSLERTGHDPSIVDDIDNPFDNNEVSNETSGDTSEVESDEELEYELSDQDSLDADSTEKDQDNGEEDPQEVESHVKDIQQSLNTISRPSLPVSVSKGKMMVGILLLVLIAGGVSVYSFMPDNFNPFESADTESSPEPESLQALDAQHSGCPASSVRIQSVSSSEGVTTANVQVSREEAQVVLIVMQDEEVLDFTTDSILGETEMSVEAVGDQAKLRPLGCEGRYSLRDY